MVCTVSRMQSYFKWSSTVARASRKRGSFSLVRTKTNSWRRRLDVLECTLRHHDLKFEEGRERRTALYRDLDGRMARDAGPSGDWKQSCRIRPVALAIPQIEHATMHPGGASPRLFSPPHNVYTRICYLWSSPKISIFWTKMIIYSSIIVLRACFIQMRLGLT